MIFFFLRWGEQDLEEKHMRRRLAFKLYVRWKYIVVCRLPIHTRQVFWRNWWMAKLGPYWGWTKHGLIYWFKGSDFFDYLFLFSLIRILELLNSIITEYEFRYLIVPIEFRKVVKLFLIKNMTKTIFNKESKLQKNKRNDLPLHNVPLLFLINVWLDYFWLVKKVLSACEILFLTCHCSCLPLFIIFIFME